MTRIRYVLIVGMAKMLNKVGHWRVILLLILIGVLSGCCACLPPGTPPSGEIIKITVNKEVATQNEAYDYLATSLMSYFLTENINNFSVSCDKEISVICNKFVGFISFCNAAETEADFILQLIETEENILGATLQDRVTKKILWQDSVKVNKN